MIHGRPQWIKLIYKRLWINPLSILLQQKQPRTEREASTQSVPAANFRNPGTETSARFQYLRFLFWRWGRFLANHPITSEFIQPLQFKQLFIKRSTQRQQTSFASRYINSHQGKDLSKQLSCPATMLENYGPDDGPSPAPGAQSEVILPRGERRASADWLGNASLPSSSSIF